jgi:hypothetical protein
VASRRLRRCSGLPRNRQGSYATSPGAPTERVPPKNPSRRPGRRG